MAHRGEEGFQLLGGVDEMSVMSNAARDLGRELEARRSRIPPGLNLGGGGDAVEGSVEFDRLEYLGVAGQILSRPCTGRVEGSQPVLVAPALRSQVNRHPVPSRSSSESSMS